MTKLEIAKHFKDLVECEQFVLTGSMALNYLGFKVTEKDVDIVLIKPSEESLKTLRKLAEVNPPSNPGNYTNPDMVRLKFDNTDIDFFVLKDKIKDPMILENGIIINSLNRIVQAKKDQNRSKDWMQLMALSRQIVTDKEVENHVNSFNS